MSSSNLQQARNRASAATQLQMALTTALSVRPHAALYCRHVVRRAANASEPHGAALPPRQNRRPLGGYRDHEHLARWANLRISDEQLREQMLYIGLPAEFVERQIR